MALSWTVIFIPILPRSLLTLIKALLLYYLIITFGSPFSSFLLTETSGLEICPSYGLTLALLKLLNSEQLFWPPVMLFRLSLKSGGGSKSISTLGWSWSGKFFLWYGAIGPETYLTAFSSSISTLLSSKDIIC